MTVEVHYARIYIASYYLKVLCGSYLVTSSVVTTGNLFHAVILSSFNAT